MSTFLDIGAWTAAALVALAVVNLVRCALRQDRLRPKYRVSELADPDRDDPDTWPGVGLLLAQPREVHYWPPVGDARLDCCQGDPFTPGQPIHFDPRKVTCEAMRIRQRGDER